MVALAIRLIEGSFIEDRRHVLKEYRVEVKQSMVAQVAQATKEIFDVRIDVIPLVNSGKWILDECAELAGENFAPHDLNSETIALNGFPENVKS